MNKFLSMFKDSSKEMYHLQSLVGMAMLIALSVVLSFFSFQVSDSLKIGPGFLVTALLGMLYGPVAGGIAAGAANLIKFFIKPTGAFFFGYTLTAILGGVVYGLFFYKKRINLWRAISAKTCVNLFLNSILNTYWIAVTGGKAMGVLILPRLMKNLIALPLEIIMLYVVLTLVVKILNKTKLLAA